MKINVILKKEDIEPLKITHDQTVVVLDILLATSTIVSLLHNGAKKISPVVDEMEALSLIENMDVKSFLLIGEKNGQLIDGFLAPNPLSLHTKVNDRKIVLLTTNGTVAIRKVSHAGEVYIASLLNGAAVAKDIYEKHEYGQTINIVCSGSSNQFCMEDFYGAGYFIHELLVQSSEENLSLTDSARSALLFYRKYPSIKEGEHILRKSSVGKMLVRQGFSKDLTYVSEQGKYSIIPKFNEELSQIKNLINKRR